MESKVRKKWDINDLYNKTGDMLSIINTGFELNLRYDKWWNINPNDVLSQVNSLYPNLIKKRLITEKEYMMTWQYVINRLYLEKIFDANIVDGKTFGLVSPSCDVPWELKVPTEDLPDFVITNSSTEDLTNQDVVKGLHQKAKDAYEKWTFYFKWWRLSIACQSALEEYRKEYEPIGRDESDIYPIRELKEACVNIDKYYELVMNEPDILNDDFFMNEINRMMEEINLNNVYRDWHLFDIYFHVIDHAYEHYKKDEEWRKLHKH